MQTLTYTRFAFAVLLLTQSYSVIAQQNDKLTQKNDEEELSLVYGDKSTVSIATGSKQSIRRAPAVASVITAEDIAAMGYHELCQVLSTVPGISCQLDGLATANKIGLRGLGLGSAVNTSTLLLQNGVNLATQYSGDRNSMAAEMPVRSISRIEIIRGPGSALYGADAYAGVINIITKTAAEIPVAEIGVNVGSQKTREFWWLHGGKIGKVEIGTYIRAKKTNGNSEVITADAATRNDTIFKTKTSNAPGSLNNQYKSMDLGLDMVYSNWRVNVQYQLIDDLGSGTGYSYALNKPNESKARVDRLIAQLNWNSLNLFNDLTINTNISYQNLNNALTSQQINLLPPGTRFPTGLFPDGMIGGPQRFERHLRLSAYMNYTGWKNHLLRIGGGWDDLDLYKTITFKNFLLSPAGVPIPTGEFKDYGSIQPHILPTRRKLGYLYAQDEWEFAKDWVLTSGIRYDNYSDFGKTINPRLALVWDTTPTLTNKILFGRAFRAPTFNESYGINPVANGNINLKPETISTLEWAGSWQASNSLLLNMNVYRFKRKNIIVAIPNVTAGTGSTYTNFGNQNGRGMELEVNWDFNRSFRLTTNYSYQRTTTGDSLERDIGYAPHHKIYARADWRFSNNWQLNTQLNWVADRARAAGDNRAQIADYKTVDMILRTTRPLNQWDFSLSVRNLFNTNARDPSLAPGLALPNDLPLPRRTAYLEAVYKF
ncbi:TonB-dependent receptor [Massilia sp. W12]|uniref:TonB-dependent receptor plug domain-containing protein n=1 Tax=Massilia sp. W12 TaxID=3126507 RepID=UPI0030D3A959